MRARHPDRKGFVFLAGDTADHAEAGLIVNFRTSTFLGTCKRGDHLRRLPGPCTRDYFGAPSLLPWLSFLFAEIGPAENGHRTSAVETLRGETDTQEKRLERERDG